MTNRAYVVFGLSYGDEGKGAIVDFVTRQFSASTVIRHTGGAQAGHNVISPDGRWHCFSQFGSGALNKDVSTYLSHEVVLELENLAAEAEVLIEKGETDILRRLVVSADCAVTTPAHKMSGRLRELARGDSARGTCGLGIGETVLERERGEALTVRDILSGNGEQKLRAISERRFAEAQELLAKCDHPEAQPLYAYFRQRVDPATLVRRYRHILETSGLTVDTDDSRLRDSLDGRQNVVFEGSQGTLIDRRYGFTPYVTKTRATWHNAGLLVARAGSGLPITKIGVMTASMARHGAGPFVTEDESLRSHFDDARNTRNRWQGRVRVGALDLVALRYAIAANNGVDTLVITALDRLTGIGEIRVCTSYIYEGDLAALDPFCEWEKIGDHRARVTALRKVGTELEDDRRAKVLFACKPLEWISMPDWSRNITDARRWSELPPQAQEFIARIEKELGVKTLAVSVNPTATGKLLCP